MIRALSSSMSLPEKVGQLLFISFEFTDEGDAITSLSESDVGRLREIAPGGVVLYGMNLRTLAQTVALVNQINREAPFPPIIATDHEGGLVARLNTSGELPATVIPTAATVGAAGDLVLARQLGVAMANELRSLGITMNFAPVIDVDTGDADSVLGRHGRAFGSSPASVAAFGVALVSGMQSAGVSAVVKHFPGHGSATADSHDEDAVVLRSKAEITAIDLLPFRAAFAAGADGVMTAHVRVPALSDSGHPATLDERILDRLLRDGLGFDGLAISDAINMRALTHHFPEAELAVRVIDAGGDIVLKPFDPLAARDAIVAAVESGALAEDRIESALVRVLRTKLRRGVIAPFGTLRPDPAHTLGAAEHQAVVDQISEAAAR